MNSLSILKYIFILIMTRPLLVTLLHFKCRGGMYPRSSIQRFPVPDDKVDWSTNYEEYNPMRYDAASLIGKPWADSDIG